MKKSLYIIILIALTTRISAQSISGSWYGHADVELSGMHNNYLTELVIKQKGTRVEGIFGYYFRDKYQSFFIHGRYNPETHEITILNIPVIFYGSVSTLNSIDCNTNFRGIVIRNKMGSTVKGTFYHDQKYKYTCPDLKVSYDLDKSDKHTDSTISAGPAVAAIWKPKDEDYVVDVAKPAAPPTPAPAPVTAAVAAVTDSTRSSVTTLAAPDTVSSALSVATPPEIADAKKIEESFAKRKATNNRIFEVESDSIRLSFYDNGEIDGDSISVFVNDNLVLSHQELAAKAFNLYLHLDSTRDVNEISMYAENLGRIPPNTALMVLTDGKNRYEVFMSSSLSENATIRLKRKRPAAQ